MPDTAIKPNPQDPHARSIIAILERSAMALGKMGLDASALNALRRGLSTGKRLRSGTIQTTDALQ